MDREPEMQMECFNCKVNVEDVGGAQMKGCHHFLCANCIVKAVKASQDVGIKCKCQEGNNGVITSEELSFMVPPDVYAEYLKRVNGTSSRKRGAVDASNATDLFQRRGSNLGSIDGETKKSKLDNSNFVNEDTNSGWSQVSSVITNLVDTWGMTYPEAMQQVDSEPIIENKNPFPCSICLDDEIPIGQGVILKECYHQFCKACLARHIESTDTAEVKCPFVKDDFSCGEVLKPREINQLVSKKEYDRHFEILALKEASETLPDIFHCLTPDCKGFCATDTESSSRIFLCPLCNATNCVICKVIHEGGCAEYWDELEAEGKRKVDDQNNRIQQRKNDALSASYIEKRISKSVWMRCPKCHVVIEKNGGCNHMQCRKCLKDFNWTAKNRPR
ncbi:unnamed protein product [Orchesella dallaii]|uniref:RanBP-type and C3HC4-type zinc finger-containing protein 1 n=1 Tax=Orchesella dallaii TaxID=48710 RepID=A0ABP1QHN7_9HEXA